VKSCDFDLILLLELFEPLLVLIDFVSEDSVHLLSLQELVDHVAYVSVARSLFDLLESLFDSLVFFHFLLHLAFQELTPQLLNHKVITLLDLVGVLAVVLGVFSDLGLSVNSVFALL